jgi:DNA-binding SARP family transcriptional activator/tetratricopeptide (TPR) repeat protein
MIALSTLGTLDLVAPRRPESLAVVAQPKRMALLVYLAVARPRGPHRRDSLLALFWPESDQERGRQVLRQTVYLLRRSLGKDALVSRGDEEVGINPQVVSCDVSHFDAALADGRLAEALEFYRGDFLSGFHPPGVASEFEDWIAAERKRLREAAATAAWTLASQHERRGVPESAAYWARRAVALDRDNEDAVRDLMLLLVRCGDRSGAARIYEEHARRLRDEYGIEEPGATLRQALTAARAPESAGPPVSGTAGGALRQPEAPTLAAADTPASAPALAPSPPGLRRPPARRPAAVAAAIVLGVLVLVWAAWWRASAPAARILAVGPITEIRGADSVGEAPAAGDLLATSLARLSGIEVVPAARLYDVQAALRAAGRPATSMFAAARLAGARQMVRGTLHARVDGTSSLDLQVLDLRSGAIVRAFRAEGDDLFALVDHATTLIAGGFGVPVPATPITSVTTRSVVAYRLFEEGLRTYYAGDARAAYSLLRASLEEDSTFAMAEYYAALAAFNINDTAGPSHLRRAALLANRAPERERLLIRYRVAEREQAPEVIALSETLAIRYPNDPDAQYALGGIREREGDFAAAAEAYRRAIAMDSVSLRADRGRCLACEAYGQLVWAYLFADSAGRAEAVAREFLRRRGVRADPLGHLAVALAREGRTAEALAAWHTADSLDPRPGGTDRERAWLAIRAADFPLADSLLRVMVEPATREGRAEILWDLAISLRSQGRLRDALALNPEPPMRAQILFESGRFQEAAALFSETAYSARVGSPVWWARHRAWYLTHVATSLAAAGDSARLAVLADSIERVGALSTFGRDPRLHHYVRGLLWAARGDLARAASEYRLSVWSWSDGYTRANYQLSRTLLALGRPREAIYPLQAALRGDLQSSNLYVTRTELHELLGAAFAAAGQRDSAATHYALVAQAWRRADPAFAARRARAEASLAATR